MNPTDRFTGIVLIASSSVFFGTIPIFAAALSTRGVGVWVQVGARLLISTLVFAIGFAAVLRKPLPLPRRDELLFPALNGMFMLFAFTTYILSIALGTPPAKAVLIAYLYPIGVAVLSRIFLREALTRRQLIAIAIGLAGIALTLEFWAIRDLDAAQPGDVFALMNSLATASLLVFGRWGRSRRHIPPLNLTLWSFGFALLWLLLLAGLDALWGGSAELSRQLAFDRADPAIILGLIGIASLGTAIPYILMYAGLGSLASGVASILLLPEVISVFVLSALFLGQSVSGWQLGGGALILLAGMLILR